MAGGRPPEIWSNRSMCTAILSIEPGGPVLLAGFRDEFTGRAWDPPGRHWPDHPGLIGGRDRQAGGTWLAVAPGSRRVATVLNGRGTMAPEESRRTRGVLPLLAADEGKVARDGLADFDPFHLLIAELGTATLWSWDGDQLAERELAPGWHMVVNSGLAGDLVTTAAGATGRDHELARISHFLPRLRAAPRPVPRPGPPAAQAWGQWLPLMNGDGISPGDPRALVVRHDLGDGRVYGTTSISLVALDRDGVRYDFTGRPGDPDAWYPVDAGE
jgi:Transport and Golgi organisation 2